MKQKKDKISIITTFYNNEKFILYALDSVRQQVFASNDIDVEYIIVDDRSTDSSYTKVKNYLEKGFKHKIIKPKLFQTPENLGCGGARKFGIDQATGNYFMFLDGDDYYIQTTFVDRAYHDLINEKADIVEYGVMMHVGNGDPKASSSGKKIIYTDSKSALLGLFKDSILKFNVWNKIYKGDIVHAYDYDTTRTYEDVRTIPFWFQLASKIVVMPSIEINWRKNGDSIIRNNQLDTRTGTIRAFADLFDSFNYDKDIMSAIYKRAMIDISVIMDNHSSEDPGFNEMSQYNTKMLSYLYPNEYQKITFNIENH